MNILITGLNSYLGNSFKNYLASWPNVYNTKIIDLRKNLNDYNFNGFDVIFHCAGIAHDDTKNADKNLYYRFNTDLTAKTAQKAKAEGIKQFIYMSSSIVYGKSAPIGENKIINLNSPVNPASFYGESKILAENELRKLKDDNFKICIIRAPMIYGKNSKGNYKILSSIAQKVPAFPKINNLRSMLYIGNFVEFVKLLIDNKESGTFWPQNNEYSNTSQLIKLIAEAHNKKILLLPGFKLPLKILACFSNKINKAFGNLVYDQNLSEYKFNYRLYNLKQSINLTENF